MSALGWGRRSRGWHRGKGGLGLDKGGMKECVKKSGDERSL